MHYELLEVKKHHNELVKEKQQKQKQLQETQPPFVYNEHEFPSISNQVVSSNIHWRLQQNTGAEIPNHSDVVVVPQPGGSAGEPFIISHRIFP